MRVKREEMVLATLGSLKNMTTAVGRFSGVETNLAASFFAVRPRSDPGGTSKHRLAVRCPVIHGTVDDYYSLHTP